MNPPEGAKLGVVLCKHQKPVVSREQVALEFEQGLGAPKKRPHRLQDPLRLADRVGQRGDECCVRQSFGAVIDGND
ncbi:hypothetical protein GCM10009529_13320 [Micropruina glycogenica]